jgi:hypothetical protein
MREQRPVPACPGGPPMIRTLGTEFVHFSLLEQETAR